MYLHENNKIDFHAFPRSLHPPRFPTMSANNAKSVSVSTAASLLATALVVAASCASVANAEGYTTGHKASTTVRAPTTTKAAGAATTANPGGNPTTTAANGGSTNAGTTNPSGNNGNTNPTYVFTSTFYYPNSAPGASPSAPVVGGVVAAVVGAFVAMVAGKAH